MKMRNILLLLLACAIGIPSCSYIGKRVAIEQHAQKEQRGIDALLKVEQMGAECRKQGKREDECLDIFLQEMVRASEKSNTPLTFDVAALLTEHFLKGYREVSI